LKPASFIYAASRAEKAEKMARFAPSSEGWVSLDARNQVILAALLDSDYWLRRYREVEQFLTG
jgi:hypothetical protein